MRFVDENVPTLKIIDSSLRVFLIPLSVASIWLTLTTHEDNSTYGNISFTNFTGLKYLVCISAISGGYALVAAVSTWVKLLVTKAWIFFVSDQLVAYLLVTSEAALAEIMYLAYHGDIKVSWSEECTTYGSFCNRLKIILSLNSIAICCFLVLSVISAYRVFSRFEPPFLPSKQVQEQDQRT